MAYILRISALRFRAPWLRTDVRALRGTQCALNCLYLRRFTNDVYTSKYCVVPARPLLVYAKYTPVGVLDTSCLSRIYAVFSSGPT